ncbi:MAG TPA: DUF2802 domain-containing protein [Steroidobacteraceae bacterium]
MIQTATLHALPDHVLILLTGAVVIAAGILIAVVFAARIKRSATLQSRQILDGSAWLAEQLEQLGAALAVTDARIATLAARLEEQSRSQGAGPTSYNVAIRLARSGATRQELITTCGVTQQEADLVLRLHATDPTVRSAA